MNIIILNEYENKEKGLKNILEDHKTPDVDH